MEFNIVDKRKEFLQEGDWVTVRGYENSKGYLEDVNQFNSRVVFIYPTEMPSRIIDNERITRLPSQPKDNDIKALIDLALDMEDKEWFEQLCKQKNAEASK